MKCPRDEGLVCMAHAIHTGASAFDTIDYVTQTLLDKYFREYWRSGWTRERIVLALCFLSVMAEND